MPSGAWSSGPSSRVLSAGGRGSGRRQKRSAGGKGKGKSKGKGSSKGKPSYPRPADGHPASGTKGSAKGRADVVCHFCQKKGHYARDCRAKARSNGVGAVCHEDDGEVDYPSSGTAYGSAASLAATVPVDTATHGSVYAIAELDAEITKLSKTKEESSHARFTDGN